MKRFTDTCKFDSKWFRRLPPEFKLAWLYVLDKCDPAGVIRIDEDLANFQIGVDVDWPEFLSRCEERIARLPDGKVWITDFIVFQYKSLSRDCAAHKPVFDSICKHDLKIEDTLLEPYRKAYQSLKDKDKDKDKEKDQDKNQDWVPVNSWVIPAHLDRPEVRNALDEFAQMRKRIRKPIRDFRNSSRVLPGFETPEQVVRAVNFCIGNEYQGLKPEYGNEPARKNGNIASTNRVGPGQRFRPGQA